MVASARAPTCLNMIAKRAIDNTEYVDGDWAAADFKSYRAQRIAGATIIADAQRCFKRLERLRGTIRAAAHRTAPRSAHAQSPGAHLH